MRFREYFCVNYPKYFCRNNILISKLAIFWFVCRAEGEAAMTGRCGTIRLRCNFLYVIIKTPGILQHHHHHYLVIAHYRARLISPRSPKLYLIINKAGQRSPCLLAGSHSKALVMMNSEPKQRVARLAQLSLTQPGAGDYYSCKVPVNDDDDRASSCLSPKTGIVQFLRV